MPNRHRTSKLFHFHISALDRVVDELFARFVPVGEGLSIDEKVHRLGIEFTGLLSFCKARGGVRTRIEVPTPDLQTKKR